MNLLKDLRNFNEILRKGVTYGNIKSHKKQGFTLFLEVTFLEKEQGEEGVKLTSLPAISGLKYIVLITYYIVPITILLPSLLQGFIQALTDLHVLEVKTQS